MCGKCKINLNMGGKGFTLLGVGNLPPHGGGISPYLITMHTDTNGYQIHVKLIQKYQDAYIFSLFLVVFNGKSFFIVRIVLKVGETRMQ